MSSNNSPYSLPCRLEALFPEETFTPAVFAATLEALSSGAATLRCGRLDGETLNLVMRETRHARIRPPRGEEGVVERYRVPGRIVWVEDSPDATRFGLALDREGGDAEIEALTRAAQEAAWGQSPEPSAGSPESASAKRGGPLRSLFAGAKRVFLKSAEPRVVATPPVEAPAAAGSRKIDCRLSAQFSMQTGSAAFDVANFRATITSVSAGGIQASIDEDAPAFRAAMRLSGLSSMALMHARGGWLGFDEGERKIATWMRMVWLGKGATDPSAKSDESVQAGFALWGGDEGALYSQRALERAASAAASSVRG
jgi:hypothetical protein